jgi:hypothetical protein
MLRVALLILASSVLLGQDPRGAVGGQVTDATGAAIPGAAIKLRHVETNVLTTATTNESGQFQTPYLPIGNYTATVEAAGFKLWTRGGIQVRIGDRLLIDVRMEVGALTESVEVSAEAPVLESVTGSIGQVISSKQLSNLPLRSGSISWMYSMVPGAVLTALPYDGPWNIDQASNIAIAGVARGGIDFNIDGVSNNSYNGATAMVPPPDMVEEVRVETTSYDAAIGHTAGGSVNVSLKSGTNAFHGTAAAFVSSGPMMSRNFFTNAFIFNPATGPVTPEKIKANTPSLRWLRYSAAVGGPVYLPKLYDGRNKTFWMFGYQTHLRRRPNATQHAVPTAAQRNGDFSALLAVGRQYQLYDPHSTVPAPNSRFSRSPLPNNIVPASRIDPVARKLLSFYPEPNAAGTVDGQNNYQRTRQDTQDLYQPLARVDHNFSEKHRLFARYSHSDFFGHFDNLVAGSNVRGRRRRRPHRGVALDQTFVVSPQQVLNVRYGFTWFNEFESFDNIGFDLREFGLPASLINELDPAGISFPQLNINGGYLQLGNNGGFNRVNYSHSLLTVLNWNKGNHALKMGFDGRLLLENNKTYGNVSPVYTFGETYTRGPLDNSPISPIGQGMASFLYGIPTAGGIDLNDSRAERSNFYGLFLQDDFRILRRLTLNLGIRWEYESPIVERFNRTSRDFDFQTVNPIQSVAAAQYARAPIPDIPPGQFRTLGGLTFAGVNGLPRSVRNPYYNAFMPRIGFAFQWNRRTVIRGGYGIFFSLLGAEFDDVSQPNFNRRTNIISSLDNGQTYVASISNPFPNGLDRPSGAADGLTTFLGRSPGFFSQDGRRPYTQRWSYSIQIEPFSRSLVEVGYIGSRSTRLQVSTPMNDIPRRLLSTSPERDNPVIDFLSARATNPFLGIPGFSGTAFFGGVNTTRSQLLRPYPHFADLSTGLPAGASWYHAFTSRFERRFSSGLLFQANYTWSKTMEAVSYLNSYDPAPEHVLSTIDRPHRLTASGVYELPIGRAKKFLGSAPAALNHIAGGWQVQAIFQMQPGPPLNFTNAIYRGTWEQLRMPAGQQSLQRWFNTAPFERNAQLQLANNIRSLSSRTGAVRSGGINLWDISAHKNIRVHEKLTVQLRGEAEGAMNHPNFSPPNNNPINSLFGQVTSTQTGQEERRFFAGLKLLF